MEKYRIDYVFDKDLVISQFVTTDIEDKMTISTFNAAQGKVYFENNGAFYTFELANVKYIKVVKI